MDAVAILVTTTDEQLRAAASARLGEIRQQVHANFEDLNTKFMEREEEYLQAVADWKRASSPQERAEAAARVGSIHVELEELETHRQAAKYPHRTVQTKNLLREVADPDTRDKRTIPYSVFVGRLATTTPASRQVPVTGAGME